MIRSADNELRKGCFPLKSPQQVTLILASTVVLNVSLSPATNNTSKMLYVRDQNALYPIIS
jgi:hypothetical protein